MREIKFRAWTDNENKMYYLDPKVNNFTGEDLVPDEEWHLMQYTGLKDKNGVDIYEGDIVSVTRHDGVFCGPDFTEIEVVGTPKYEQLEDEFSGGGDGVFSVVSMEILGNIHQNPELLA